MEDIPTRINERPTAIRCEGVKTSKEFEGILPGRLLGFVLHVSRQTGSQTSVVASHSIRAEAALEPYSQSQTTVVELHSGQASAAPGNFTTAS